MDAPLIPGEVLGYRAWRISRDGQLMPLHHNFAPAVWRAGVVTAKCINVHEAPSLGCRCGIYAHHEAPHIDQLPLFPERRVYGAIMAWGQIDSTPTDFRAQFARIVCLSHPERSHEPDYEVNQAKVLAVRYGVPYVPYDALTDFAHEFGREIPLFLRGLLE